MARQESDREDLFAEATALVRRWEFLAQGTAGPIVAGFRGDGAFSIYLSAERVYHFNASGELKRAYRDGLLYRTQGETLAALRRQRTPTETTLLRRDLSAEETETFLREMAEHLAAFAEQVKAGKLTLLRCHPESEEIFMTDLLSFIDRVVSEPNRLAARFRGKR